MPIHLAVRKDFFMSFRKYSGKDKYHFRYYHLSNNHPFLVVLVLEEKKEKKRYYLSGFNMTTSPTVPSKKPTRFLKLKVNPNPDDNSQSYLKVDLVKLKPSKLFSDPLSNWHLSKEDEKTIEVFIKKKYGL